MLRTTRKCTFSTSDRQYRQKVVRACGALCILTSKRASRHKRVHFSHISTSKSRPNPRCFHTFYFQMCFAPKRPAPFRHRNLSKRSEAEVFCTFSLPNVFRAAKACNFSSFISRAGSAPAALASLLFDSPEPQNSGKTECLATFLSFPAPASSLF